MIFRDADCGAVPITDAGKPVGVITDRDVALALASHETDLANTPVGELMSKDVLTIGLDDSLELAMEKLETTASGDSWWSMTTACCRAY